MQTQITIDGAAIHDIASFYEEINRVFMSDEDWKIGQSLDAFSDLLYGGFGALKGSEPVDLIWLDLEKSRDALGYQATKVYYEEKLKPDSPFNKSLFQEKLTALENGVGETYFDILIGIIAEHGNIQLIVG